MTPDADRLRGDAERIVRSHAVSRSRLIEKLIAKGHDAEAAIDLAREYERIGAIDDAALAQSLIEAQLARAPAAADLLRAKLMAAGINEAAADAAIGSAMQGRDPREDALEAAKRRLPTLRGPTPQARQARLASYLARKGFDAETCEYVVRRLLPPGNES